LLVDGPGCDHRSMNATHVLCPLDGTIASVRALPSAVDAARLLDVPLRVFSAVEDAHEIKQRTEQLDAAALQFSVPPPRETDVIVAPHAPDAIAQRAHEDAFVVMATSTRPLIHHGYLGSATEKVVRELHRPVLAVGPRATTPLSEVGRVVVPCDGSSLSEQAIEPATRWAERLGLQLWIVTVIPVADPPPVRAFEHTYVERLAERTSDGTTQWDVLHGDDAARAIAEWAEGDLIVMTSHGRSGLSRLTLGSVASGTARWATGPVLMIVPDGELADDQSGDENPDDTAQ